jgi:hypothetical protein
MLSRYSVVSSYVELQVHPTLRHSHCCALTAWSLAYCRDCTSNYSCVDGYQLLTGLTISLGPFLQLPAAPYIYLLNQAPVVQGEDSEGRKGHRGVSSVEELVK